MTKAAQVQVRRGRVEAPAQRQLHVPHDRAVRIMLATSQGALRASSQGASGQARDEDAASVYGYTMLVHYEQSYRGRAARPWRRVESALDDVASNVRQGLADIARHVAGCRVTQDTRG